MTHNKFLSRKWIITLLYEVIAAILLIRDGALEWLMPIAIGCVVLPLVYVVMESIIDKTDVLKLKFGNAELGIDLKKDGINALEEGGQK